MVHQIFNSVGFHIYNGIVYENFYFENNFHNSFEYIYIMDGEFDSTIHSTSVHLTPGDCLLISPNLVHDLRNNTKHNKFFTAVFSSDFVSEFYKSGVILPFYKFRIENGIFNYLNEYMMYTGTPDIYIIKSCAYAICAQAIKTNDKTIKYDVDASFVLAVNNYIFKNQGENFSRKDIADALNYEEHYFSTLFSRNFRISFNKYINMFRFERACKLLLNTKIKVTDIAFSCGFGSLRSFNRIFKELSGKSPNEYRNSYVSITEPDVVNMKSGIQNSDDL